MRSKWTVMATLILVFVVGYLSQALAFWDRSTTLADLIVPAMFLLGAAFVWLTSTLSLQTAIDVRRVTLLERESITDPLTEIYNRRYMDRRLAEELARAQRYGLPLSVLLLDIDHFKHTNDTFGHAAGDLVLRELGNVIMHAVRGSDVVARYGGEELLVIAPNTPPAAGGVAAERLRRIVESHEVVLPGPAGQQHLIRLTISIGVAGLGQQVDTAQTLLHRADEALYRAKRAGRNRVAVSEPGTAAPAGA